MFKITKYLKVTARRMSRIASEFIFKILDSCEGEPEFIVDKAPRLCEPLKKLGLEFHNERYGKRNIVERTSLKRRIRLFHKQISLRG